jgi:hypothetical protein
MRIRTWVSLLAFVLVAVLAARAEARHTRFLGPHPIASKFGGGYCYIEAPHLHAYAPDRPALYQQSGGDYVFTGDPTPFGYEGERHAFYGRHPVVVGAPEPVYCVIDGPHFHPYPPPATPDYRVNNGVAFYMAPIPQPYIQPARVRMVNAEYRPYAEYRPTVQVAPPPEWRGEVWVAPPSVHVGAPGVYATGPRASVAVSAPGVYVAPPRASVTVTAPGVYVPPPPHVVVGVPAPHVVVGAPGVVVGAPHVIVGAPAPVLVGPGPVFVGGHHDNGLHKGWYKGHH